MKIVFPGTDVGSYTSNGTGIPNGRIVAVRDTRYTSADIWRNGPYKCPIILCHG